MSGPLAATLAAKSLIVWRMSFCDRSGAAVTLKPALVSSSAIRLPSFPALGSGGTAR